MARQKTYCITGLLFAASLFFVSCGNDIMFATIEKETKIADPSIIGTVTSLVSYSSDLYCANGYLYKKTAGSGEWSKVSLPAYRCYQVASDGTNLYGLLQDSDWKSVGVYQFDGSDWTLVTGTGSITEIGSGTGIIFAFIGTSIDDDDYSYRAYTINGSTLASVSTVDYDVIAGSAGNYFATQTAVYNSSGTAISGSAIDKSPTSGITGITVFGSHLYVVNGSNTYHYNGTSWTAIQAHDITNALGVAYLDIPTATNATTDLLLVCGTNGYNEIPVTISDGTLGDYQNPGTESPTSIVSSDQYESTVENWNMTAIFTVNAGGPLPTVDATQYAIYANIREEYKYAGLWAYFPVSTQEWNRE